MLHQTRNTVAAALLFTATLAIAQNPPSRFEGTVRWRVFNVPTAVLETLVAGDTSDHEKIFDLDASILGPVAKSLGTQINVHESILHGRDDFLRGTPSYQANTAGTATRASADDTQPFFLIDLTNETTTTVEPLKLRALRWHHDDRAPPSADVSKENQARVQFEAMLETQMQNLPEDQQQQLAEAIRQRPEAFGLGAIAAQAPRIRRLNRESFIGSRSVRAWEVRTASTVSWVWLAGDSSGAAQAIGLAASYGAPPGRVSDDAQGIALLASEGLPIRIQTLGPQGYRLKDLTALDIARPAPELFALSSELVIERFVARE
ncbi:MAG: hypothetical protein ACI8TX_000057 [Hyphomicrobiaceae bacterium]|jgi:hypothetical protein